MAIQRKNKFDEAVQELEILETAAQEKSHEVVKTIVGDTAKTKLIRDKNGRVREVKIKEKRKAFQVYLPESIYAKLDKIVENEGKSRNGLIEQLIREYIAER